MNPRQESILLLLLWCLNILTLSNTVKNECDISKTSLNYWTTSNIYAPNGCIDRSNITMLYADHGQETNGFYFIIRNSAKRACSQFGEMNCLKQLMGATVIGDTLPHIASDVAGSTDYGYTDLYGVGMTLYKHWTGLSDILSQGVEVYSFLSGLDVYLEYGSLLHIEQDKYTSAYDACSKLKNEYNVSKMLFTAPDGWATQSKQDACSEAMGIDNIITVYVQANSLDDSIQITIDALLANPDVDGIFASNIKSQISAISVLQNNDTFRSQIKAISTFGYNNDILQEIIDGDTSFVIGDQSWLQGFLSMSLLGIKAATTNALQEPFNIMSGPLFVDSKEKAELLECFPEDLYFCDDKNFNITELKEGCQCIDTYSKTIYLFHHYYENNDDNSFYSILAEAALQAANDHNAILKVINASIKDFSQIWEDTVFNENNNIDGILTTIPWEEIGDLIKRVVVEQPNIDIFGIADGYDIYFELATNTMSDGALYIGEDDYLSGYNMAKMIHLNYSSFKDNGVAVYGILCIDDKNGLLSSNNERCDGVESYCFENDIEFNKVLITDSNDMDGSYNEIGIKLKELNDLNDNMTMASIISSGGSLSCLISEYFLNNFNISASSLPLTLTRLVGFGCFDASIPALNGLSSTQNAVDIVYDQQPWLIGYVSVLMMINRLFVNVIPKELLIPTGPKILTVLDAQKIETIRCEHYYNGYPFCPIVDINTTIIKETKINYPTTANFSGGFVLALFILSIIAGICFLFSVYIWRKKKIIRQSSPLFIVITICGGIIMMMSGLLYFGGVSSENGLLNKYVCNIPWMFWSIGFTIFFSSYSLRVWRFVNLIEAGLNLKSYKITNKSILIRLLIIVAIDIIIDILAVTVTPFNISSDTVFEEQAYDQYVHKERFIKEITTSHCTYNSAIMWYVSIGYKIIILVWVISVALRKQISTDKLKKLKHISFQEGSNISVGVYMVVASFVIFILFIISLEEKSFNPSLAWTLCTFLSFLCYITVLCVCMLHRIVYIAKKQYFEKSIGSKMNKMNSKDSTNDDRSRSTSDQSHSGLGGTTDLNDDDIYGDVRLQRAEYLVGELIEAIEDEKFTKRAATVLGSAINELNKTIYIKCGSSKPSQITNNTSTENTIEMQRTPSIK